MDVSSGVMIVPYRPIQISRENNIIQIDLPGGSTKLSMFIWVMFGVLERRFAELLLIKLIKWTVKLVLK